PSGPSSAGMTLGGVGGGMPAPMHMKCKRLYRPDHEHQPVALLFLLLFSVSVTPPLRASVSARTSRQELLATPHHHAAYAASAALTRPFCSPASPCTRRGLSA